MIRSVIRFLGQLKFAIILLMILASVLIVATFYESFKGTPAVQFLIYKSIWFGLLLFAIATNVLCAALKKYPWKIHQVGFLVTHIGIILICVGSFVTFQWGIDGQLMLQPEETKNSIELSNKIVSLMSHDDGGVTEYPINVGPFQYEKNLVDHVPNGLKRFVVDQYLPFADKVESAIEDPKSDSSAVAIHFKNQFADQTQWLWIKGNEESSIPMGPAQIVFKKKPNHVPSQKGSAHLGIVTVKIGNQNHRVPFSKKDIGKTLPVTGDLKIVLKKLYADARVENNQLVSRSEQLNNPALELELTGKKGVERHVLFSNFPEFSKIHHKESLYLAECHLEITGQDLSSPRLEVWLGPKGKLEYWVSSSKGSKTGNIQVGKAYQTGWMNLSFTIETFYPHAKKVEEYTTVQVKDPNKPQFLSAIHFGLESVTGEKVEDWIGFYESKSVTLDSKTYHVAFVSKLLELPFSLHLREFRMGTDPGTSNPASYESHVTLEDSTRFLKQDHVISMNEPLTHGGLTFYQASYQNDENGHPIATILSVGYDPGRFLKYGGSIVMVLGILLLFFFRKTYMELYQRYVEKKASGYVENKVAVENTIA